MKKISLMELFLTFLKISTFTFGGGYTIVPVIKDEFSIKRKLIDEKEMLDIVSISTSGPGPMAVNASILTGYRVLGVKGALVSLLASTLPPLVIITLISFAYKEFSENFYVKSALIGMGGAISAILLFTSYDMAKTALKSFPLLSTLIMIVTFIASYFLNINTGIIILTVAILGLFLFSIVKEENLRWYYLFYLLLFFKLEY